MTAAALGHDALLPRPSGGNGAGAVLALLVHAGLVLALTNAVDWRAHAPEVVSAELWASVPQIAAPRVEEAPAPVPAAPLAPAPPPPAPPQPAPRAEPKPPEPDIATERAARRKAEAQVATEARKAAQAERSKADAERRQTEAEARKKAQAEERRVAAEKERLELEARQADDARLARQREENLKRIIGQAGGTTGSGAAGTAAVSAAPSATYAGLVTARIRPNIVYTGTLSDNPAAEVEVRTAPGGSIIARRLVKSSGHKDWDDAVMRAIDRTPSLPRDTDGRVPPTLIIAFRPRE